MPARHLAIGTLGATLPLAVGVRADVADSLDARILYANPDCMAVVADSMGAVGLTVEERQDSVMPWTRAR